MIHQCEAVEADLISRQRQVTQPAGRTGFRPRKPRHLEYYSRSPAWSLIMIGSRPRDDRCIGVVLLDDQRQVPTLILSSVEESFDLSHLLGEDRGWNWPVAFSVALAAQRGRCVHDHEHSRKSGFASEPLVVGAPF